MLYRLCDEDRERFGCEEWLTYSPYGVSVADLEELSERFDFDPSEWPTPLFGELTLEQAGDPDAKPIAPRWQMRATVWQILRQNGHDVSWEDAGSVQVLLIGVRRREEEGKDPEPSPGSEPSTTPPSESSSTSKKRTSTG
jgi:hypothetical protein